MNYATAQLISVALNSALTLLAEFRKKGLTDQMIKARLDLADQGRQVTVGEIIELEQSWQAAIDAGRNMP